MHKRSSKKRTSSDAEKPATPVADRAIGSQAGSFPEKNPAAVALGRLGGLKGGKARAEKLSEKRRKEIAKKAAMARWSTRSPK